MRKRKDQFTKTTNLFKIVFLLIVFLGIGYAFLDATLNIEGNTTVTAPELNVYVQGTNVTSGSTTGTPTIIGNDKKEVDFTTSLTNDGSSFFEEKTTLVNKGTEKAYLLSIQVKVYDSSSNEVTLTTPYEYSLTKGDGTQVAIGEELAVNSTASYKLKFNYISGTDMTTVTDYPTYTFKITYNYGLEYTPPVCSDNENITTLSTTTCTANENVQIPSGTICKRAVQLHQEECTQTAPAYCSDAGYTATGSKGTTTITYGSCGISGTLTSGDAFTCDLNGDGTFDELAERFYYVSDYYDTTNKVFDTTTATLVYYNNVTDGVACNKNTYAYDLSEKNNNGPVTVKDELPTSIQWSNISLKNISRQILTYNDMISTEDGILPTTFSYNTYAARLLTAQEIMNGCGLSQIGNYGELDNCNYLMENTKYSKDSLSDGHWIETPTEWFGLSIGSDSREIFSQNTGVLTGARPTIEVPKTSMSY